MSILEHWAMNASYEIYLLLLSSSDVEMLHHAMPIHFICEMDAPDANACVHANGKNCDSTNAKQNKNKNK